MEKLAKFIETKHDGAIEFLRIYVGLTLLVIGVNFSLNQEQALHYLELGKIQFFPFLIIHYIVLGHVCGGFLLMIGLITRTACVIQLPILLGAVFFVGLENGFSLLMAVLLLVFSVYGGGRYSCDFWLRKRWEKK